MILATFWETFSKLGHFSIVHNLSQDSEMI